MKELIYIFLLYFYSCEARVQSRYYPSYHLAPPYGWMNDPNGFCYFKGDHHLFYQFNPFSSQEPGVANWGHAKSKNYFHWVHLPIAMNPDDPYDRTGVFSGSALIENDTMFLFYTGNVNTANTPENIQYQALAVSTDGINVTKYTNNPIIVAEEHQSNIRDPKVWKHGDTYYMVLGNSFNNNTLGRVLLYASEDMIEWKQVSILGESHGFLGYMWECPDFFELNGYYVLLFSPQGVEQNGDNYKNLYQTGYVIGHFNYETLKFIPITKFRELDHGRHFYATQTTLDDSGRRIMVAWLDMWEDVLPERNDGFTGQMTLPRELTLTDDLRVIQTPVEEVASILGNTLYRGKAKTGTSVQLENNAAKIEVTGHRTKNLDLHIESSNKTTDVLISYNFRKGQVTIYQDGSEGMRRTQWRPRDNLYWEIFIDSSSIELFCGEGEVTFSNRYFPDGVITVRIGDSSDVQNFTVRSINRTVEIPE